MHVDSSASGIQLVYPFAFDDGAFDAHALNIDRATWPGRAGVLEVWRRQVFPEDDLLAYVARYLNPPNGADPTARLWTMDKNTMQSLHGLGSNTRSLNTQWQLEALGKRIEFCLDSVTLALFHTGIGFLTIGCTPLSRGVMDWLDFLHAIRFMREQRKVRLRIAARAQLKPAEGVGEEAPFFPPPAGGTALHADGMGALGEVVDAILATAAPDAAAPWWTEVFVRGQLIPFATLYMDEASEDEIVRTLYKVRNLFHSGQGENPAPEDLRPDHPGVLAYAERQWFIFSLDGGGFVAADAPNTEFFRKTLPGHIRVQYFLVFLLALHQRFMLMMLSDRVAQNWPLRREYRDCDENTPQDESETPKGYPGGGTPRGYLGVGPYADPYVNPFVQREATFRHIRDALLAFTARGFFAQVMQREHHHRFYRKWQETFQVQRLYEEVSTEVREMHDYFLMLRTEEVERLQREQQAHLAQQAREEDARERAAQQRSHRLEKRISMLGILIGVPAVINSFLGINIVGFTSHSDGIPLWEVAAFLAGGTMFAFGMVLALVRRESEHGHG